MLPITRQLRDSKMASSPFAMVKKDYCAGNLTERPK